MESLQKNILFERKINKNKDKLHGHAIPDIKIMLSSAFSHQNAN